MEQYVITGIGIYNGLGPTVEISWKNLLSGASAVIPISWPENDPEQFPITHNSIRIKIAAKNYTTEQNTLEHFDYGWANWDPNTRACLLAVDAALNDSGLTSKNTGVVINTFGAGTTLRLDFFNALNKGLKKISPRKTLNMGLDFPAAQVAAIYRVTGPNTSMDSACTTGITAIDHAINTLKANPDLDAMIVGGADHMADPIYSYWFQNLGALCMSDDTAANCPFDEARSGFVMGEGAATVIIEPLSKAQKRNAKIYGILKSTNFYTLFDSDTSPDPEGTGAKICVQQALDKAGITANDIDYVNAHATSTPIGDQIEYTAMLSLTPGRVMVSNKGQIGHGMSAAGITETIYTLLTMRDGQSPGNANLKNPCGQGMILPTESTDINVKYAIKNSFGFGGRNASLVLERYDSNY